MRVNPLFSNTCSIQIGQYRKDPCYDCKMLEECDKHWDPVKQEWDYPNPADHVKPRPAAIKDRFKSKAKGISNVCRAASRKRQTLEEKGVIPKRPVPATNAEQACDAAGIP